MEINFIRMNFIKWWFFWPKYGILWIY